MITILLLLFTTSVEYILHCHVNRNKPRDFYCLYSSKMGIFHETT
uniref:Uncharacterized protein n=1 Tax=Anguilla anguilla TaxID=7936 RepID=A0A0E9X0A2_ANGAN